MGQMILNSQEFMKRFLITGVRSHNNVCLSPVIHVLKNLMQNNDFEPCDGICCNSICLYLFLMLFYSFSKLFKLYKYVNKVP